MSIWTERLSAKAIFPQITLKIVVLKAQTEVDISSESVGESNNHTARQLNVSRLMYKTKRLS